MTLAELVVVGVGVRPSGEDLVVVVDQRLGFGDTVHDVAKDVLVGVEARLLFQQSDREAVSDSGLSGVFVVLSGHDPQQCRLAGTVVAQDADLDPVEEGQADVFEYVPIRRHVFRHLVHLIDEIWHPLKASDRPNRGFIGISPISVIQVCVRFRITDNPPRGGIPMRRLISLLTAALLMAVLAVPASAQEEARIHLIHGIPDTTVDVVAGGEVVFGDFQFGDTQDLSALAGETLVGLQVRLAGTEDVAIDAGDTALPASGNYTIIAHLDEAGTPTLAVFENDTSTIDAGEGRLIVRHTAQAPAVDVKADGAVAFSSLTNPNSVQADLPVGTISAEVVPAGADEPVVIGPVDLPIEDGSALIVYAVGSLDAGSVTALTESITGLGTAPTAVNTGNSPVGSNLPVWAAGLGTLLLVAVVAGRRSVIEVRS